MARRRTSVAVAQTSVMPGTHKHLVECVFAQWLDRERVTPEVLAEELGVTLSYVRMLRDRRATPGAKLRLRIQERTKGAVPFDCWDR